MGAATPFGGWQATARALDAKQTAIAPITRFDVTGYPCGSAAVCSHGLRDRDPRRTLTLQALRDARHSNGNWFAETQMSRVGVFFGSESGLARFCHAFDVADSIGRSSDYDSSALLGANPTLMSSIADDETSATTPTVAIARELGVAVAPISTISFACASSAVAIAEASRAIRQHRCDIAICGGVGADVDPLWLSAFGRLGALSMRGISAPFDAYRDGFVLGEGAAILVLSANQADAMIEVIGAGRSLDAGSLTMPLADGSGAARAISASMRQGAVNPDDVVHIEAHGTGTQLNDRAEAMALHLALGDSARTVSVSASKGSLGHWIAGAGALGACAAATALGVGIGFPIVGHRVTDDECGLQGIGVARAWRRNGRQVAIVNSFGFGGANACIALERH
jgi:3-oxoacyl-[acyl-carrier-protein] synthase II